MLYENEKTNQIAFPLGGIGTGCVSLSGSGRLVDWEIFGAPHKQSNNGFSHFAVRVEKEGKVIDTRVLNSDLPPHYIGGKMTSAIHSGFGFGPDPTTMAGFPHFEKAKFYGEYPISKLEFSDSRFPSEISLTGFNPFIPFNDADSSLPAAFFEFEVKNTTQHTLDYTISLAVQNPVGNKKVKNNFVKTEKASFIKLECEQNQADSYKYGNLCIGTDSDDVSYQEYWYRGGWSDGIEMFWRDLSSGGKLKNRRYDVDYQMEVFDTSVLARHLQINPGEIKKVRFILSWYFPNIIKSWDIPYRKKNMDELPVWKNYYATQFTSAFDCAKYCFDSFNRLMEQTFLFKNALFSSTLPAEVMDAISANLSTLKSPTVLRLTDGSFYGFEGCAENYGCCEGSCQHVWNYAYALPFLFPNLERSMRENEFKYTMRDDGRMGFRLQLPLGTPPEDFRACVDGQMGAVIKTYREWKICGDTKWLKSQWSFVKKALEYAWATTNEDKWDCEKSGIITGRQHHTLDMELFGANSWLQGFYLCALKAASEMAEALNENEKAEEYAELFIKGKKWTDQNLYNGEYFYQQIDLNNKELLTPYKDDLCLHGDKTIDVYWNDESNEVKYQIGEGCLIDQVIAQWHANNCGIGEIFDKQKTKSALKSIYQYNFIQSMLDFTNSWRLYCLNDEAGLIICSWPEEKRKPSIPLTYNSETMNGFEYQAACNMIQEGMVKEAETIVKAIRQRYDGYKRNPFNEFECGSHYARSMASYALLLAYSGFVFDMTKGLIGFNPVKTKEFKTFWCVKEAFGTFELNDNTAILKTMHGKLKVKCLLLSSFGNQKVKILNNTLNTDRDGRIFIELCLKKGLELKIECLGHN